MEEPADALERLLDSPLVGALDGPVVRDGVMLKGITKPLYERYGGGHASKLVGRSTPEIGSRVHEEVRAWVAGESKTRQCAMHEYSRQAVEILRNSGMRPVAGEVRIAHGKIGTRADVVARLAFGGYALISLKTGKRRDPDPCRRRPLPEPFSAIKRCDRTLDDLQLTAELGLARAGHRVEFDDAYVLEVPEGVLRRAPNWVKDHALQDALLADLEKRA